MALLTQAKFVRKKAEDGVKKASQDAREAGEPRISSPR